MFFFSTLPKFNSEFPLKIGRFPPKGNENIFQASMAFRGKNVKLRGGYCNGDFFVGEISRRVVGFKDLFIFFLGGGGER